MNVTANLDGFETQLVFDIFNDYILKHTCIAKLDHLAGDISKHKLDHMLSHAEFAKETFAKLGFKFK